MRTRHFVAVAFLFASIVYLPSASYCQKTPATNTPLDGPDSLAMDHNGHLFVASLYENTVRRIDLQTGTIITVAGNGKDCCYKEGSEASEVSLEAVWALAVNSDGDVFIGESTQVRKVDARTGLISTVAGNGESGSTDEGMLATSTSFVLIWGLAVDANDDLFVADRGQGKIFKVETAEGPSGKVFRVAGSGQSAFGGDGGPALDASFGAVGAIAFDKSGNLVLADEYNCRIRRIDHRTGIVNTIAVTEPLPACSEEVKNNSFLLSPTALAIDSEGDIVFAETAENVVLRADRPAATPSIVAGNGEREIFSGDGGPAAEAALNGPGGLAIDSNGNVFIGDIGNNRVRRVDAKTKTIQTIAGNGLPHIIHTTE